MATPRHPTFTTEQREFLESMFAVGVGRSTSWLSVDQIDMAATVTEQLSRLPEPQKPRAKPKPKSAAASAAAGAINNDG